MKKYSNGKRVFAQSVALATTMFTCVGMQANDHDDKKLTGKAKTEHHAADMQMTAESFIKHAAMGGQLEVQIAQMAQQKAQNQQVKQLGQTLVQDHQQANQRLMQIAQQKNIQLDRQLDGKHQEQLTKFRNASGAEFDKEFVKHTVQHHKKSIQKFEQASKKFSDQPELQSWVQQTLPALQKHLQMAQAAARAVGVDLTSIESEFEADAAGAPGGAIRGEAEINTQPQQGNQNREFEVEREQQPKPRSSIETDADADLPEVKADADIDFDERDNRLTAETDVDVDNDNEVFQEGDGKILGVEFKEGDGEVLGLPTSNSDGTILGLFPAPSRNVEAGSREAYTARELANGDVDEGVETVRGADSEAVAVGGPAGAQIERGASGGERVDFDDAPDRVQEALKARGWMEEKGQLQKVTLYKATINGQPVIVNEQGQIISHTAPGQQPQR